MRNPAIGLAISILLTATAEVAAQSVGVRTLEGGRVAGRVLNAPGESTLPGAGMLTLSNTKGYRETIPVNSSGSFEFINLGPGHYTLILEFPGRRTVSRVLELSPGRDTSLGSFVTLRVGEVLVDHNLPPPGPFEGSADWLKLPAKVRNEITRGNLASQEGDANKAIRHYRRATEWAPDLFSVYNNMAVELLKLGRLEEARDALRVSIRIAPEHATTYRNLGVVLLDLAEASEALAVLDKSLELEADHPETRLFHGQAQLQLDRVQPALETFLALLESGHDSADLRLGLGNAYLKLNQLATARDHFRAFLVFEADGLRADAARDLLRRLDEALGDRR